MNPSIYSYLANSAMVEDIVLQEDTATRMTTTKAYDYLNRLTSISHLPTAGSTNSYTYAYNSTNQRTKVTQADNSYWDYGYDSLGQVISGKKRNSSNQLFPGLQYEYAFDDIGNREQTRSGGNAAGTNLRTNNYSVNLLNQYSSRDVEPYLEVQGQAATNATVTVNNQATDRLGLFFRKELTFDNSSAPDQPANPQTNRRDLWLDENGGQFSQDPLPGHRTDPIKRLAGGGGLQPGADGQIGNQPTRGSRPRLRGPPITVPTADENPQTRLSPQHLPVAIWRDLEVTIVFRPSWGGPATQTPPFSAACYCDDTFEMDWSFNFRDAYDWDIYEDNLGVSVFGWLLVSDQEMGVLHRWGWAREFEMIGEDKYRITWKKGERYYSGARIEEK